VVTRRDLERELMRLPVEGLEARLKVLRHAYRREVVGQIRVLGTSLSSAYPTIATRLAADRSKAVLHISRAGSSHSLPRVMATMFDWSELADDAGWRHGWDDVVGVSITGPHGELPVLALQYGVINGELSQRLDRTIRLKAVGYAARIDDALPAHERGLESALPVRWGPTPGKTLRGLHNALGDLLVEMGALERG
jgi:hypothetical protein